MHSEEGYRISNVQFCLKNSDTSQGLAVMYESLEGSDKENKKIIKSRNYEIKSSNYEIKSSNYEIIPILIKKLHCIKIVEDLALKFFGLPDKNIRNIEDKNFFCCS